jgi:Cu/Ag efflux protein CusF
MKTLTAALVSLAVLTAPLAAFAADPHAGHGAAPGAAKGAVAQAPAKADTALPAAPAPAPAAPAAPAAGQGVEVTVDGGKYQAKSFEVKEGEPVRLTFVRKDYSSCMKEVVFPALGIKKELPVNTPVTIELPAQKAGEVEFHCGMKMVKGKLQVKPAAADAPAKQG